MDFGRVFESIIDGVCDIVTPVAEETVSDTIARVLVTGSGPYDPGLAPYMRGPVDALGSRKYRTVCVLGPARCSKTLTLIDGWIARNVVADPGDMLIVQSSQDLARYYSRVRIKRMIEASKEVRERQSPRRQDDNTFDKLFRSGMILAFGWPSGQQLSGRDFRYVALTEYDAASDDIDGEGSLFTLASMRTQTFLSAGKVVVESSVRREYDDPRWQREIPHAAPPATGITGIYNSGTMCWLYWQCEHCGEWLALDPDVHVMHNLPPLRQLVEDLRDRDAAQWARDHAVIACRKCGAAFDESRKRQLNARALWVPSGCTIEGDRVVGAERDTDIYSCYISSAAACFASWDGVLQKYAVAIQDYIRGGDETEIKSTVNLHQGRAYLPLATSSRTSGDINTDEREDYPQAQVPSAARFLVATIDVQAGQRRGFVVQVMAYGAHRERWIVDRYALRHSERRGSDGELLPCDPAGYVEDWNRLIEKCITRSYPLGDGSGRVMAVRLTACDSGGEDGVTARAYDFHRHIARLGLDHKFRLVKGRDTGPRVLESYPDARGRSDRQAGSVGDVPVLLLNTDAIKDTIAADLERKTPGPGYLHIPRWMDPAHVRELSAETRTAKGWEQKGSRHNETIDLCVYAEACYTALKADAIDWRNPPAWAGEWDVNELVTKPGETPKEPGIQRRKSTFWGG